ncbi:MAG TPA: Na+/H+ antiporter subunit E [Limnobacter sp.]|nr:Na+/H+ antiporter subunit E [Limnobacter sp.]
MIKKLLPDPWLSLALILLWLILNRSLGLGHALFALVLGVLVPVLVQPLRPLPVLFRKPLLALGLFAKVGWDVIVWNCRVLRGTLASGKQVPKGGFVVVPLDLRNPNGLAVLAAILCVIPGTVWSELSLDGRSLLVHVFDMKDAEEEITTIKLRYEKPLMEIFQ